MGVNVYDTVIFDLGGVLIDWNPRYLYKKIFSDPHEMEFFLSEICSPDWNEEQDGGRTLQEATEILIRDYPDHAENIHAFYQRWEEMLGGVFEETIDILEILHKKGSHQLLALTNWSAETFPIAKERYDFLGLFEGILVSGEEKMKKPDAKIFELLIRRYQLNPKRSLFIDDNKRNVKAARATGLEAVRFVSPAKLRSDLKALHILV